MDMLGTLTVLIAGIGGVLIAIGMSQIASSMGFNAKAWSLIKYGAIALAVAVVLGALNSQMSKRKSDQTVQQPPPAPTPWNNRNPNNGGPINYDPTCGYRPDGGYQPQYPGPGPQYPGPGGNYNASRQFYIVGTISSGPGGSNLALESGASTLAVAK